MLRTKSLWHFLFLIKHETLAWECFFLFSAAHCSTVLSRMFEIKVCKQGVNLQISSQMEPYLKKKKKRHVLSFLWRKRWMFLRLSCLIVHVPVLQSWLHIVHTEFPSVWSVLRPGGRRQRVEAAAEAELNRKCMKMSVKRHNVMWLRLRDIYVTHVCHLTTVSHTAEYIGFNYGIWFYFSEPD